MKKAIAIDFDGCICRDEYPLIGEPNPDVIAAAKREQDAGAGLILWTCREGELLQAAIDAAGRWGLVFDAINDSLSDWKEAYGNSPRKVSATEYWDDRAVRMPARAVPGIVMNNYGGGLTIGRIDGSLTIPGVMDDGSVAIMQRIDNKKEK